MMATTSADDQRAAQLARLAAMCALDIEYFRAHFVQDDKATDHVVMLYLHKARYECPDIEDRLRLISGEYLRRNKARRWDGSPLLAPGELP
jgi:hypothetical protein